MPVGLAVAFFTARTGYPTLSGYLFLLVGPVLLWAVGQRLALKESGNWLRAGLVAFGIMMVVGIVAFYFLLLTGFDFASVRAASTVGSAVELAAAAETDPWAQQF